MQPAPFFSASEIIQQLPGSAVGSLVSMVSCTGVTPRGEDLRQLKKELEESTKAVVQELLNGFLVQVQQTIRDELSPYKHLRANEQIAGDAVEVAAAEEDAAGHPTPKALARQNSQLHEWTKKHFRSYHSAQMVAAEEEARKAGQASALNATSFGPEGQAGEYRSLQLLTDSGADNSGADEALLSSSQQWSWRSFEMLRDLVRQPWFEQAIAGLILVNACSIGYETDWHARNPGQHSPAWLRSCDAFFCVLFIAEMVLRIGVHPVRFFTWSNDNFGWNIFDFVVVLSQLVDLVAHAGDVKVQLGLLRILRIVRVVRLFRVIRLFEDLRTMLSSIVDSIESLAWALLLLTVILYMGAVAFCQCVVEAGHEAQNKEELQYWFGNVARSLLTMFESIVGGVSWDEPLKPLIQDISPVLGVAFSLFIAICVFAVLNTVTGVFVAKITSDTQNSQAAFLASRLRDLFFERGNEGKLISLSDFQAKLSHQDMEEYFRGIDMDPKEAGFLFALLDIDGSGNVTSEELVNGCLRLSRPAQALDVSLLMREVGDVHQLLRRIAAKQAVS